MQITAEGSAASPDTLHVGKDEFRDAMARLGTAVNIITTDGPGGTAGFTASAVCSVTDTPPTLLICLNRAASVYDAFSMNDAICVNTLSPAQQELSQLFGGKTPMQERFGAASWTRLVSGAPALIDATVAFDCRVARTTAVGSHVVMFCTVLAVQRHPVAAGLIYFDRRYHTV